MDEAEEGARLESGLARELIRCEAVKENLHHKKKEINLVSNLILSFTLLEGLAQGTMLYGEPGSPSISLVIMAVSCSQ